MPAIEPAPSATHREALAAHRAGSLRRAEELYRRALVEQPDDVESLHMLGVAQFERTRYAEALDTLWDALDRTGWRDPVYRHNLGLVLGKLLSPEANARQEAVVAAYLQRERARTAESVAPARVSVVLIAQADSATILRAIDSVTTQTWRDLEFIVAGDCADPEPMDPEPMDPEPMDREPMVSEPMVIEPKRVDEFDGRVAERMASLPFRSTLVRGPFSSIAQAANAGAHRASGNYLAFLADDCRFARDRIATMVAEIARASPLWGFSRVGDAADAEREPQRDGEPRRADVLAAERDALRPGDFLGNEPASFTLLRRDITGARGNLFVERGLFLDLGGFRDVECRDWDFAVRAARVVEPVAVDRRLYFRGEHDGGHEPRPRDFATDAIARRVDERVADALAGAPSAANDLCPQFPGNRRLVLRDELRAGRGDRIPIPLLRSVAAEWRERIAAERTRVSVQVPSRAGNASVHGVSWAGNANVEAPARARAVALVVLGVYRSGTSAFTRALNLCGATLPQRLVAARLALNPTGFWEAEAVTDLDVQFMHRLGADWNTLDVKLPDGGPLVEEFLVSAREILDNHYGGAALILIKDPRICMLAPLWHRALKGASYRPAYLVPVRHPLEVARSFEAQGDVSVNGLAVWHAYMRRAEAFTRAVDASVAYVRYAELLDDWRSVVRRIARQLDIPLDVDPHSREVDRFLEPGMRRHRADDAALDRDLAAIRHGAALTGAQREAVRDLYRRFLDRCDRDARGFAVGGRSGVRES
ncbi:MAG: glycosyltransferase [Casimicrobiaceae bacterium]